MTMRNKHVSSDITAFIWTFHRGCLNGLFATSPRHQNLMYCAYPKVYCVCSSETVPVQRRNAVNGFQTAACRHHIEAVSAVTGDVEVVFRVAVLHHHDEACPAVGQVVACHSFTTLWAHTTDAIRHAEDACERLMRCIAVVNTTYTEAAVHCCPF